MTTLTAERLVRLAYKYPSLENSWFLIACACLSVLNQPQEIPKVYHFALRQQLLEFKNDENLLNDKYLLQLAQDSISSSDKFEELSSIGIGLPDVLIPFTYYSKLPLGFKFNQSTSIFEFQNLLTLKFREVLLKVCGLIGIPKTINSLTYLKNVTPTNFRSHNVPQRPNLINHTNFPSSQIIEEDSCGTRLDEQNGIVDTIDGPISPNSINTPVVIDNLKQGSDLWNKVYSNNLNRKIRNQIYQAYPDLWYFIYQGYYSNILSYSQILSDKETSLCIITSLIPQDVNPQLKGHLRGALNLGVPKDQLTDVRSLVFDICDWVGGNYWKGGKDSVAKL
ncbi:hypothetical protein PSN45_002015 [Yamadazyma tenuis]|uniref:Carboxymuconolactone decarboxylase n=1 Tax=Candida tenuis (strain ATCC 10573 / BCRC 21748 / CBS 615 / JCM 9827 / NBRC 10315 / NRRL Y-1498 / VKM Y-70) TaxID=590646 RepID=G3BCX6_CANTC|nr:carboxymuconolactone decarboxylase [Yamadazyma tenuis ATCC 10573]XP_006690275.1 uncharacterized protein CANTEDRAFT_116282 [Yamadazyma tenuis ATCC 10573]EGV61060.1 carboxymuconolactone decarboxylase [Yamadazyma tenuis ATCC 10573]EGV61061.1 hypothetical protein CANTEDRAFT_116282 [Yamadazyma tenuis ATCC 10573]WEJ94526.1 hypothetical protein PSN45_002015 [Yamadazyma tenuis]